MLESHSEILDCQLGHTFDQCWLFSMDVITGAKLAGIVVAP